MVRRLNIIIFHLLVLHAAEDVRNRKWKKVLTINNIKLAIMNDCSRIVEVYLQFMHVALYQ